LRLGAEIGSNAVPGADVVGDAAMIADILEVARESEALAEEVKEAMEFMDKGPYTIEELQASTDYREFSSYDAFRKIDVKKVYGSAGEGKDWHHIVEQGLKGDTIPQEQLQSTKNIVRIPRIIHEMISSESSSPSDGSGVRLRDQLRGRPFGEKYQAGLNALKKIGILKD